MQQITFEYPPIYLALCALLGIGYAYLQYSKGGPWPAGVNKALFVGRSMLVFLIAALLVAPVIRLVVNHTEQPSVVIAVDNSTSLSEVRDSTQLWAVLNSLNGEATKLRARGFDVEVRDFSGIVAMDELVMEEETTNLSALLTDISNDYEGRNLSEVLLVSDGIYNAGMSPAFDSYAFPVSAIGVGDTLSKSDVSITTVLNNKLAYEGNQFPVHVQVANEGYAGEPLSVTLSKGAQVVEQKNVVLPKSGQLTDVEFLLTASESGFQRYQVNISRLVDELTYDNNSKAIFIEVIDGKQKIALIASAPHPDMMAIRSAIEMNANYQLDQYVLSNQVDVNRLTASAEEYDLIIYHQLPGRRIEPRLSALLSDKRSSLYIVGGSTDLGKFNAINPIVQVKATGRDSDKITAAFNNNFSSFKLSDELQEAFEDFPPLLVPFGSYSIKRESAVLLHQRVGSIVTERPLLVVSEIDTYKSAVMMSSGLWKWKLADYASHGNNSRFNELISKLVQYLSTKDDRRKFRFRPVKSEFKASEPMVFDVEAYNDLYEEVFGITVKAVLKDADGKEFDYSFMTSPNNTQLQISGLDEGVYSFTATAAVGGEVEAVSGEVVVKALKLESLSLTADFKLLRDMAMASGGKFFSEKDLSAISDYLASKQVTGVIHTSEEVKPFINLPWLMALLLLLVSAEWFTRKYQGSY